MIHKRLAFTMLELIFVIVIMGILGKYGVDFLTQAYHNFVFSKINNDLQANSESAVEFISKRLEHRIKDSTRYLNTTAGTSSFLSSGIADPNADVLEWIETDDDSFRGKIAPLWSGVMDINSSTSTQLVSPGSNFATVNTYITNLSDTTTLNDAAIYFKSTAITANPWGYTGAITDQSETLHPIAQTATNNILAPHGGNFSGKVISEYYTLSWTANAVRLENYSATTHKGDLYFYYDYQPWQGEAYSSGKRVLLAKDISAFRFRSMGSLIKIQVCSKSDLLKDEDMEHALCKEKTVF
jgi:type II secretory pathway pseudopilin PulG